jgi:hypothetical protein
MISRATPPPVLVFEILMLLMLTVELAGEMARLGRISVALVIDSGMPASMGTAT